MPLGATDLPGEVDAFGVRFTMQHYTGPVRCHVLREALDWLGDAHARTDGDALSRFTRNRAQFEALASDLYDGGHRTPWIGVEHLIGSSAKPEEFYDD